MYVIATDSRRNKETLFMVDRSRQKSSFWSNRLDDVMKYADKDSATRHAMRLKFNSPRVITLQDAKRIAREQEIEREIEQSMDDAELGWDAHKGYF